MEDCPVGQDHRAARDRRGQERLFEKGAQGATVDVVSDMLNACLLIDEEKWSFLIDYHGPHIQQWEKAMRTLRKERYTLGDLAAQLGISEQEALSRDLYDILIESVGKLPLSM